jgi:transposase
MNIYCQINFRDWYNIKIPEESLRRKVHKAGYSWKSSRPSPYKGDKKKQEDFKKTSQRI